MIDFPVVSVIITTKNEEHNIANCLESIKSQTYPQDKIEIIVVDNNSTDRTKEISARYTEEVYNIGPERSAQRNFGVRQATGKYILYLDADMILSKDVISECVSKCEDEKYIALYIPERIVDLSSNQLNNLCNQSYWIKVRDFERSFYNTTVIDCVRFVQRDKFLEIGGFDENLTGPEDWDFDRRIKETGEIDIINSPIYHNEGKFNFHRYINKKLYYAKFFNKYIQKWGKDDAVIERQLGLRYRLFGIFIENDNWKKLLRYPILMLSMYFLRIMVGIWYYLEKDNKKSMDLDKYSKKYIHYCTEEVPVLIDDIFNKYNVKKFADLGSGDGAILYSLSKKGYLDNVEKVVAVDISNSRLENVKKISDKILCIVADVCRLEMLNNMSLDLVMSNQVIEHIPDEEKFIKEVYRLLSKDGLFYLSTVFKKWYGWYFYRCNGRWVLDPTHIREYTDTAQLLNIIKKYNFEILKNKKTLFWFPITDFISKRIGMGRNIYNNKIMKFFRNIKIPILGYYNWTLLLKKRDG